MKFLQAFVHLSSNDGWAMASHVALSLMIAMFPFLIFIISFTGFLGADELSIEITRLVFDYWPEQIATPIVEEMYAIINSSTHEFMTLAVFLSVFFASNGIEAIRVALNRAYGDYDHRSIFALRLQSLLFIVIGAILMLFIAFLFAVIPVYFSFINVVPSNLNWLISAHSIRWVVTLLLLVFSVFACHRWLPAKNRHFSALFPGILLTFFLWGVCGTGFSLYITYFASYSTTYAGLAGIMTALIFLYLMSSILIFGAEYNAAREGRATK